MGIRSYFTSYLKKNVRKWFSIFMSIFYHKSCTARLKVRGLYFIICVIGILVFSQRDDFPLYTPGSMKSYDAWTPKPILRLFYLTQCNKYIYSKKQIIVPGHARIHNFFYLYLIYKGGGIRGIFKFAGGGGVRGIFSVIKKFEFSRRDSPPP